jgi:hypothetical protein
MLSSVTSKGGLHGWAWIVRFIYPPARRNTVLTTQRQFLLEGLCKYASSRPIRNSMLTPLLTVTIICALLARWKLPDVCLIPPPFLGSRR